MILGVRIEESRIECKETAIGRDGEHVVGIFGAVHAARPVPRIPVVDGLGAFAEHLDPFFLGGRRLCGDVMELLFGGIELEHVSRADVGHLVEGR